ncbi:Transcription factor, MADS-box [Artemisia annua]|uniref:Transcription factor, MADS-box n=1 Tax=Artemisia annua TaxID=35608 RepID=A0A2U1QC70_ARTAN|nr:Transcription factor, MADS-box [Artemisia annua]
MNVSDICTMKKNTLKGRKKIPIKKIEETSSRQVTFSKRRTGLFKKASELCVLTGAEMAILVQSPGGHCYAFGHPSVDAVINRYMNSTNDDNNGSTSNDASVSPKQPSLTEVNQHHADLSKELEMEKRKHELIQQEKIGNSSGIPWYAQDTQGMEVEELEQFLAALVELKRKVLVRADDLANMESASMLSLGASKWNNLSKFDNAPLSMPVFADGIKFENNTMNGPTSAIHFGDGIKTDNNIMNGPTNGLDFGDGIKFENNTMNGPSSAIHFGDGIKTDNNIMNGPTNYGLDFGDGIKFENNTMNGPSNGIDFVNGIKIENNAMLGPTNALDFGDGNNHENYTMNGPTNDHLDFGDLGLDLDHLF